MTSNKTLHADLPVASLKLTIVGVHNNEIILVKILGGLQPLQPPLPTPVNNTTMVLTYLQPFKYS